MMAITSIGTKEDETYKAFRYFEKLGICFEASPRHKLTFTIGDESTVFSPIFYMFKHDDLIDLYIRIKSLGFFGRKVIKTMIKVINDLSEEEKVDLLNNFYCRSFSGEEIVKHFMKTLRIHIHKANVKIGDTIVSKKTMRNIYFSFGRSNGVKYLINTILKEEISFFRKVRTTEEAMGVASIINIPNIHLNPCVTCKHCTVDKYGCQICKECYVDIPENMTVEEVNNTYPFADMYDGKLQSKYILHNFDHCNLYKSRIGACVESTRDNFVREGGCV